MSQSVQASVALQLRQLTAEARNLAEGDTSASDSVPAQQLAETFMTARFNGSPVKNRWGDVIEEAGSLIEEGSSIDSLAGYGWPDMMPHNTDKSAVVSSLAQTLANKHQADLRERKRGAAAWNVRVTETHHRRIFVASPRGAALYCTALCAQHSLPLLFLCFVCCVLEGAHHC